MFKTASPIADEVLEKTASPSHKAAWQAFVSRAKKLGLKGEKQLESLVARHPRAAAIAAEAETPLALSLSRVSGLGGEAGKDLAGGIKGRLARGEFKVVDL